MKGNKRKGRRAGTWELRVDAGRDPLTGRRQQKSVIFHGTAREADVALAELGLAPSTGFLEASFVVDDGSLSLTVALLGGAVLPEPSDLSDEILSATTDRYEFHLDDPSGPRVMVVIGRDGEG